ncbi:BZ3500_MvSof-1268-A1-R1_Chr5-2g07980 [Microbotryum saponariae]|uniref:BZ3500_MvSof-1268-A1-R1_Chr5-2g07980 protein n=1 Tax=Microbotryum saponariae TaxID=289078 RepID=A0A2X0KG71_9BASI|nr:BZ3500_MvSof-1268-A1-R1_Chr5-2g07980 [Microbotryum saponariae]SDA05849.1 BZ3501_MvSof-1269-A2-R1_Chr5-2g07802 [Microbotryum saponariae]
MGDAAVADAAPPGLHVPRLYQEEAMDAAVKRNIICRMDTGTGKTLIAILLTRHITSQPVLASERKVHRLVVFIVPTVSLVDQVAAVLRRQTTLTVATFIGAMGVEYWKREQWVAHLANAHVVVMTAQIWLDILTNAYWDLERVSTILVSLIVFDEAHHCSKRHPYAQIMKDHYHPRKLAGDKVPRILALTASPIFNAKSPEKSISELEANLDARIYEVSSRHADSIQNAASKPKERLSLIAFQPSSDGITPSETIFCREVEHATDLELDRRIPARIDLVRRKFGKAGLAIYLSQLAKDLKLAVSVQDRLEALVPASIDVDDLATHARALVDVLAKYRDRPEFHGICFMEARHDTQILTQVLRRVESFDWLRPAFLVGHGDQGKAENLASSGMKVAEQQCVVAAFRTGEVNLVCATKVAEEGLDFRACNVVIRFDGLQTMTGYIQSRGRAREKNSDFVVLAQPGSIEEQVFLRCQKMEPELRAMYGSRTELPEIDEDDGPELPDTPVYRVPETGALLTYGTAIPLLSEYCSLLRADTYSSWQRPDYKIEAQGRDDFGRTQWKCDLATPMIHAFGGLRTFHSEPCPSKRVAKQSVAFQACLALHTVGAIDKWMLPIRERLGHSGKDAYGRALDDFEKPEPEVRLAFHNLLGVPGRSQEATETLHVVELSPAVGEPYRIGFVTDRCLGSILADAKDLVSPEGDKIVMKVVAAQAIQWESQDQRQARLSLLQEVNRQMTRAVINRRIPFNADFELLWAPLEQTSSTIDWDMLDNAFVPVDTNAVEPGSRIIVLSSGTCHVARLDEVRKDVTTRSDSMAIDGTAQKKRLRLIERYPAWWIFIKVAYRYHGLEEDTDEQILTVTSVPVAIPNYLCSPLIKEGEQGDFVPRTTTRNYPVSMCRTCKLDERFWAFIPMIPSLERLITDILRVSITAELFDISMVDRDLLRQALTPPSVMAGPNYEILETVGDSFLKLATTVHIYFQFPGADEGRLSVVRQNSVSNTFLRALNLAKGYSNAILARKFLTAHWIPEHAEIPPPEPSAEESTRGVEPKILAEDPRIAAADAVQKKIGRKTLADVIESTLGAAIKTGGMPLALQVGEQFGLCFGGVTPWHLREGAARIAAIPATEVPVGLLDLERRLGYKFERHGRLLLQAITHRSCRAATTYCYEREEFLGDALLDYWATDRIFKVFENATPRHLTFMRALLVSNPTLAFLSIRKLDLHKTILHGSASLELAMLEAQEQAESMTWAMVLTGDMTWLWSPPKVLGDAFEAILGAIFLDGGCRLEPVFATLDRIYAEVMPLMRNVETRDPLSRLLIHSQANGCQKTRVKVARVPDAVVRTYEATAMIHDVIVATRLNGSQNVARQLAARDALELLEKESKEQVAPTKSFVEAPCTCREEAEAARVEAERLKRAEELDEEKGLIDDVANDGGLADALAARQAQLRTLGDEEEEEDHDEDGEEEQSSEPEVVSKGHAAADAMNVDGTEPISNGAEDSPARAFKRVRSY